MALVRYLLVEKPQGLQDPTKWRIAFRAPTYTELFEALRKRRTSEPTTRNGCAYQYYPEQGRLRFEIVDAYEEPGCIVHDEYWSWWVPGEPHVTLDDATSQRYRAMELE